MCMDKGYDYDEVWGRGMGTRYGLHWRSLASGRISEREERKPKRGSGKWASGQVGKWASGRIGG
jgi:hypothetical protein